VMDDLRNHLEHEFGTESRDRYFAILEELYAELGYADYLGALQRYRLEDMCDPRLLMMSSLKSRCCTMSSGSTQRSIMSWWTISCAF